MAGEKGKAKKGQRDATRASRWDCLRSLDSVAWTYFTHIGMLQCNPSNAIRQERLFTPHCREQCHSCHPISSLRHSHLSIVNALSPPCVLQLNLLHHILFTPCPTHSFPTLTFWHWRPASLASIGDDFNELIPMDRSAANKWWQLDSDCSRMTNSFRLLDQWNHGNNSISTAITPIRQRHMTSTTAIQVNVACSHRSQRIHFDCVELMVATLFHQS